MGLLHGVGDLPQQCAEIHPLLPILQSRELLVAAARHSKATAPSTDDDVASWVKLLPPDRCSDYVIRLAHNEPSLSRLLVKELRELAEDGAYGGKQTILAGASGCAALIAQVAQDA
ncbi:hypothetical protein [Ktedonobacter robiniae]|uniref:Uncharacterized protein n=1 Tax=Ktedonobacter robiniae TaxID=2778365 RepID=A0ABQ3UTM9_9CHLR|nr:hypothetical protein [Ktedonobacter robiniae]GHO56049.1 hypothetical protein KSB_45240 [Ktedonobacter robiniae]